MAGSAQSHVCAPGSFRPRAACPQTGPTQRGPAAGRKLELKDWQGRTALFWASQEGRVEAARELLAQGANADTAKNDGMTPLDVDSLQDHLEVVRELLSRGAAVDTAINGELLARGASPGLAANDGSTALSVATANGHAAIVQLLRAALEA